MDRIFTLEALPALKGDCLIVHFGDAENPRLCVIDGGPGSVYANALRPRLEAIRDRRNLDFGQTLQIDLLMVSHVDDDHINGVLDFADELQAKGGHSLPLAEVDTLWHNSFDEIIGNRPPELGSDTPEARALASFSATAVPAGTDHDVALVLASIRQSHALRGAAEVLDWEVNAPFDTLVLDRGAGTAAVDRFGDGLEITVLGPQRSQLQKLQKKYDDFLRDNGLGRDNPEAALAALSKDRSVANLSSIVVLMRLDGKSMLLTGDARGDHILESLAARGLASEDDPLHVDILKLQHHGSDRNVSPEFFRRVKARHYVFCGNGKHGNPERQTLQWLFDTHGNEMFTLHFTYDIATIDVERKKDAEKHHKPWSPEQHALAKLFDQEKSEGRDFEVSVPKNATGIRIDLLDVLEG